MESIKNIFDTYIKSITAKFSHVETSEMGYRTDFEILLKGIFDKINVRRIDHDAKAKQGNKPDFIILKHDVPILYIEAKDLGTDLNKVEKSEQMARYFGYANLILSDYVEFRFYRNGIPYEEPLKIAKYDLKKRKIEPLPGNFEKVANTIIDFTKSHKEPIRSGKHLSQIMGGKAQRIRDNIKHFLSVKSDENRSIISVYEIIKKQLVHDLSLDSFADMYAQTLVYGLFVARYHDESPENFTRQEARDLVPASNPLLRHFFDHIVGADFDKRLEYIVNELCEVFQHADVQELMKEYYKKDLWGDTYESPDPVIHFYEDFLKEYDPGLRKKLGAYYTPLPVVRFIVRAVDKILERDFGLLSGLADTSKTEKGIHRVQILDPAVGTGTFISTAIRTIYQCLLDNGQKGRWTTYVHHDLLPRIHGFELMMAPYTIAHLKLSMAFKETGFKYFNRRLGIYLTNSLEESEVKENLFGGFGFAESIAEESKEASKIKNETPIMVVIGNPPYSVSSSNKGKWIQDLIQDYKTGLNERNIQPLSDDYIKFIRFAEYFIEKNKSGIVAMITNNSFIDGIIHRQMRKHLLETFDDIYILDLHGNSKKKEKAPDGSKDENVFDIMQGVSINIFVKKEKENNKLANVFHHELFGLRNDKFKKLNNFASNIKWKKLYCIGPNYFFIPKDFSLNSDYQKGFKLDELFNIFSSGITTFLDNLIISLSEKELENKKANLHELSEVKLRSKYKIKDTRDLKLGNILADIPNSMNITILYRPFDKRKIFYSSKTKGVVAYPRYEVMQHLIKPNLAILSCRQQTSFNFQHIFISNCITERCSVSLQTGEVGYVFPLYLYSDSGSKVPNLNPNILEKIEKILGKVTPEEILDYIYAVLHSPDYREKYKEFLKIDFPRIPYPKDKISFQELVKYGIELRLLHLLESPKVNQFITTYPVEGTDEVEKLNYIRNKVYINKTQYFGNVPEIAWNFYIGGYQPAQKWLKDRKGRTLTNEDIEHYQKIIVSLAETHRIMGMIKT
ncbi:MAG: N-6 DNA methylase [Ignavibacteria bacterium]|nr:N-6 DNA methylase [Ignavibacteria bacterium]